MCLLLGESLEMFKGAGVVKQKTSVCHHPVTLPATIMWMPHRLAGSTSKVSFQFPESLIEHWSILV